MHSAHGHPLNHPLAGRFDDGMQLAVKATITYKRRPKA